MGLKEITPVMIHLPGYPSGLKELELRLSQVSSEWLLARVSFQLVWGKYVPKVRVSFQLERVRFTQRSESLRPGVIPGQTSS